MLFKRFVLVFVVLTLLFTALACSNSPVENPDPTDENTPTPTNETEKPSIDLTPESKKIKVSYFVNWWEKAEQYQYIFDEFSRKYPDYEIDYSVYAGDIQQLAASIQAGTQADVWMGGDPNWAQYVTAVYQGLLSPMDVYLENDPDYNFDNVNRSVLDITRFADGKYYAIPHTVVASALVWNKDVFAKSGLDPETPPKTWSEFYDYAKKMLRIDSNGSPTQLGIYPGPESWVFDSLRKEYVFSFDGTKSRHNEPWVMENDEYCSKFPDIYGGEEKLPAGTTFDIASGNVGMQVTNLLSLNNFAKSNIDFGFSPLPRPDDYDEHVIPAYIWMYMGIPKGAENPKGGWLFAKYAVTEAQYLTAEQRYQENPSMFIPDYVAHKPTRDKIYNMFLSYAEDEIKDLVEKRDEMVDQINYYYPYSPLQMRNIELGEKWGAKLANGEVNQYEMYEGFYTELQAELDQWKKDMINKGWQFPEDGAPIPPQ